MKKVLILVLSSENKPYDKMIETSLNTWDSIDVENTESIYYCEGEKENTSNIIYLPVKYSFKTMGEKTIQAFEWALKNKEFDYVARVHSSCYVDKKALISYVQTLPLDNIFSGVEATSQNGFQYLWGGGHYIISKDVIQKLVDNRVLWNHRFMEDESMSIIANSLGVPYHTGKSCSLNKVDNGWLCLGYGGESLEFKDFADLKKLNNHFYRVKIDADRNVDGYLMNELFKAL